LADAYRRLRKEGLPVQLFVVGHGPYSEALAKSLPGAFFTGYLRGTELAAAYASADIFVFPSTTDTFGNVILEAHASGLPVVVSDSGGPKELVADKANGLITRSHDVEDFTRAIRALVTNRALRERMAEKLRSGEQVHRIRLPATEGSKIAWLHSRGEVLDQTLDDDEMELSVRLSADNWARFQAMESA